MAGKKKRERDEAYLALQRLMHEPGSEEDIWDDLTVSQETDPNRILAWVLRREREYTDRDAAIIFAAMLEHALEAAISSHFVGDAKRELFSYDDDGPLATFASKISIGRALGVFDDRMRKDLTRLKKIRNAFAHARVHVDFSTKAIVLNCNQLLLPTFAAGMETARQKYVGSISYITGYFDFGPKPRKTPLRFEGHGLYERLYSPRGS